MKRQSYTIPDQVIASQGAALAQHLRNGEAAKVLAVTSWTGPAVSEEKSKRGSYKKYDFCLQPRQYENLCRYIHLQKSGDSVNDNRILRAAGRFVIESNVNGLFSDEEYSQLVQWIGYISAFIEAEKELKIENTLKSLINYDTYFHTMYNNLIQIGLTAQQINDHIEINECNYSTNAIVNNLFVIDGIDVKKNTVTISGQEIPASKFLTIVNTDLGLTLVPKITENENHIKRITKIAQETKTGEYMPPVKIRKKEVLEVLKGKIRQPLDSSFEDYLDFFSRTAKFHPHRRSEYLTRILPSTGTFNGITSVADFGLISKFMDAEASINLSLI